MSDFANQGGEFSGGCSENPANRVFDRIDLQLTEEITMEYLLRRIEALERENVDLRVIVNRCYTLHGPPPPQ
jgi:hypothetical protein